MESGSLVVVVSIIRVDSWSIVVRNVGGYVHIFAYDAIGSSSAGLEALSFMGVVSS